MPDFHRRQDPVCPVPSTEPAIEAQPDLRATASSQNPWYERVDGELIPGLIGHNIDSHTITNTRTAHLSLLRDRKFHAV